jgi:hypothetical protein
LIASCAPVDVDLRRVVHFESLFQPVKQPALLHGLLGVVAGDHHGPRLVQKTDSVRWSPRRSQAGPLSPVKVSRSGMPRLRDKSPWWRRIR